MYNISLRNFDWCKALLIVATWSVFLWYMELTYIISCKTFETTSLIHFVNIFTVIATALTEHEIRQDWQWLFDNVCSILHSFDNEDEITEFVCCKINSLIATKQDTYIEGICLFNYYMFFIHNNITRVVGSYLISLSKKESVGLVYKYQLNWGDS